MGYQDSFTKVEREIQHDFRQRMMHAETCEDAKRQFSQLMEELLAQVLGDGAGFDAEDIRLQPEREPHFVVSDRLRRHPVFRELWQGSDLRHVIARTAQAAAHRCTHMSRQHWRTTARSRSW